MRIRLAAHRPEQLSGERAAHRPEQLSGERAAHRSGQLSPERAAHRPQPPRVRRRSARGLLATLAGAAAVVGIALPAHAAQPVPTAGGTYFVDAVHGNDGNNGRSPATAWKSLDKVDAITFQPGNRILFHAGDTWDGQLWPKGDGSALHSIVIGSYGTGPKPQINGDGQVGDAVRLFNQQYWEIHDLDVTNALPATDVPGENLRDLRGIHISGDNSETLNHFVIDNVAVHDVTGEVDWIGGSVSDNAPGVRFKTGWDGSKHTGGIVFDTTVPDIHNPPATATVLNDILVENSSIVDTSFAGIVVKQYTGDGTDSAGNTIAVHTGWGSRTSRTDAHFTPHTNIVIRDNYLSQGGTAYGCDAIYLTDARHATVDHNVVYKAGTSGIETYSSDDVVVQRNEVYDTERKAGGADFNGIDADITTTGVVIQYNFVHDNGDGILLCQCGSNFGDVRVRYNVVTSNSRYQIYLHSVRGTTADVYNNTVYNDSSNYLIYGYGSNLLASYTLRDNALYSTRDNATLTESPTIQYSNNFYGGATLTLPTSDTTAVHGDPMFVAPDVTGPYGTVQTGPQLQTAYGFRVQSGSPLIDSGTATADNGGRDYAGTGLYVGAPDIGAFEYAARS